MEGGGGGEGAGQHHNRVKAARQRRMPGLSRQAGAQRQHGVVAGADKATSVLRRTRERNPAMHDPKQLRSTATPTDALSSNAAR
jgi:hypothetical protein